MEILELNNISKSFGAIKALDNVSLSLRSGEVLGLMGDNGAGKSTLIKIIAGNFKQSSGTINFENQKDEFSKPMEARDKGIEVVYQDLALCDNLTAASNVLFSNLWNIFWTSMSFFSSKLLSIPALKNSSSSNGMSNLLEL